MRRDERGELRRRPASARLRLAAVAALTAAGLLGAEASPSWSAEAPEASSASSIGWFGVGDGLEGLIDEADGAMTLTIPVGGIPLQWDSRAIGANRHALGFGWSVGVGHVDTIGGVRLVTTTGRVHESDASHPSGLAGYGAGDLRFAHEAGVLPARADGARPASAYEYVLHAAGGTTTYFDARGNPVAKTVAGAREDWEWHASLPNVLTAFTDTDGVRTELDYDDRQSAVVVRRGANLGESARLSSGAWTLELDRGRMSAIVDPEGGRTLFTHRGDLVERIDAESGATTSAEWRTHDDGVARVARLTVRGEDGAVASERWWSTTDDRSASSWPMLGDASSAAGRERHTTTELSDGRSRIRSTYDGHRRLERRELLVASRSGGVTLRAWEYDYAGENVDQAGWSRPVAVAISYLDAAGGERLETETSAFDEYGRPTRRVGTDGAALELEYPASAEGALPAMLPVRETTTTPDGLRAIRTHALNTEQTAVLATESSTAAPGAEPTRSNRVEYDTGPDGFVTESRVWGDDRDEAPLVTRRARVVDLHTGTRTVTETVAAGTAAASTTSQTASLAHAGVVAETDAAGTTTSAAFDALGRPVIVFDGAGRRTTFGYASGRTDGVNSTTVTSPDGVSRTEVRDALGRVIQLHDDLDHGTPVEGHVHVVERRQYPDPGTIAVTDAWGATTTTRQDTFGRTIETIAPNGLVLATAHDDVSNTITSGLTPTGRLADAETSTTERRDAAGHIVAAHQTRSDGRAALETDVAFDGLGRLQRRDDGITEIRIDRDQYGHDVATTLAPSRRSGGTMAADETITATRRFDAHGNSVEKTLGNETARRTGGSRTMDELGRTSSETDQLGRVGHTDYTADGLPSTILSGSGTLTEHTYHPKTRALILTRVSAAGRPPVTTAFERDPTTDLITAAYDPADRAGTAITYTWNGFGELDRVEYPDGRQIRHQYDPHGRRIATTDVDGNRTEYRHEDTGSLAEVVQTSPEGETARVAYEYDLHGRVVRLARGNGVTTTTTYTSAGEVETERTDRSGMTQSERRYAYDARGNLVSRTDIGEESAHAAPATTTVYRYDVHDRLTRSAVHLGESETGPVRSTTDYELTVSGDIARETVSVGGPGTGSTIERTTRDFDYDPLGRLQSITTLPPDGMIETVTQVHDEAGNLVLRADGGRTEYDAADRPVRRTAADGAVSTFGYWSDGTRREMTTSRDGTTTSTRFYWDDTSLMNERISRDGEPETATAYLLGADRHARTIRSSETDARTPAPGAAHVEYHGTDRHGNVTDLTNATGELTEVYTYTDYGVRKRAGTDSSRIARASTSGEPADPIANRHGYAGEYTDDDGTQFLQERSYDPRSMRFERRDPAKLHNAYAFGDLNPITKLDPTGRTAQYDGLLIGLSVLGAVAAVAGLFTGGASLSAFGVVATTVSAVDAGIAITEALHVTRAIRLSDDVALGLAIGGLASGVATSIAGLAKRVFGESVEHTSGKLAPVTKKTPPADESYDPSLPRFDAYLPVPDREAQWKLYFATQQSRKEQVAPILKELSGRTRYVAHLGGLSAGDDALHGLHMSLYVAEQGMKNAHLALVRWSDARALMPPGRRALRWADQQDHHADALTALQRARGDLRAGVKFRTNRYDSARRVWVRSVLPSEDSALALTYDAFAMHAADQIDTLIQQVRALY